MMAIVCTSTLSPQGTQSTAPEVLEAPVGPLAGSR
jgi:hypothetical protein